MRSRRGISGLAMALALVCGSVWWSSYTTMIILHDDAKFTATVSTILDKPAVRAQLSDWTTAAIDKAAPMTGADLTKNPVVSGLRAALTSQQNIAPMVAAVTAVTIKARDQAVTQLDAKTVPKTAVSLDLAPLLEVADIKLSAQAAQQLGLAISGQEVTVPLLGGDQLQRWQQRYDFAVLAKKWAGWLALLLLAVSVVTSAKPFRTVAIFCGLVAVLAVVAPIGLARLAGWAGGNEFGALIEPVLTAAARGAAGYATAAIIVGAAGAVGFGLAQLGLDRLRRGSS